MTAHDPDDDLPPDLSDHRDVDDDLSCWDEHDEPEPRGEHPLAPHLDALATAAEALQTWSSDLASRLGREGPDAKPTAEELGEGRRLAQAVDDAWQEVRDRAVWEG